MQEWESYAKMVAESHRKTVVLLTDINVALQDQLTLMRENRGVMEALIARYTAMLDHMEYGKEKNGAGA